MIDFIHSTTFYLSPPPPSSTSNETQNENDNANDSNRKNDRIAKNETLIDFFKRLFQTQFWVTIN